MAKSWSKTCGNFYRLFIALLATYRLARLFAVEDGPFMIFERLRRSAGRHAAAEQKRLGGQDGPRQEIAELLNCPYCLGVWFAGLCWALSYFNNSFTNAILHILAIAGGQAFLQEVGHAE